MALKGHGALGKVLCSEHLGIERDTQLLTGGLRSGVRAVVVATAVYCLRETIKVKFLVPHIFFPIITSLKERDDVYR